MKKKLLQITKRCLGVYFTLSLSPSKQPGALKGCTEVSGSWTAPPATALESTYCGIDGRGKVQLSLNVKERRLKSHHSYPC